MARLRDQAGRTPDGSWVTGAGYVEYKLREDRHPTRADLDAAVPDRPAVLYHTSLHACVLNSAALREAGFADGQPDPPGGAFGRDHQGRLDGVIFEGPMFALFERNLHHDLGELGPDQRARVVRTPANGWPHSASPRSAKPICAATRSPPSPRPTRLARCTSGSTAWSCTTRWTGCWRPGCGGAGRTGWPPRR